uniref:Myc box-dependent-interacting protein 1 n=1 Tax=Oncorhynchus mykiss TaxID=8022 RepID=A0A8C7R005_ONCMY
MQKRLSRAQEKVLQKLGKADETRDTAFEEGVANFNKQMAEGTKLQKDLRAYLAAVKTMHDASKRLQDCLADMYEPEWFGKEEVDTIAEETDILWSDYHDKLADNSMIAMDNYLAQFPDIKARIAKRDRKMTDYDSARHHFGSLQKGKKQDQAKIAKAEEELGRAQKVFEEINVDLQDELPQLWNSRVGFYVNTFQSMAGYQQRFHKDMGKLNQDLNDIFLVSYLLSLILQFLLLTHGPFMPCGFLSSNRRSHSKFSVLLHPRAPWPPLYLPYCLAPFPPQPEPEHPPAVEEPQQNDDKGSQETKAGWEEEESAANQGGWGDDETGAAPSWDTEGTQASQACWDQDVTQTGHSQGGWGDNGAQVGEEAADAASDGQAGWGDAGAQAGWAEEPAADGQVGWAESGQTAISLCVMSKKIIIQVKAMHDYAATDGDELEMKAGDVVLVLAWENPDEQDDGWLMGVKESHWLENKDLLAKGVFPENFTQKL